MLQNCKNICIQSSRVLKRIKNQHILDSMPLNNSYFSTSARIYQQNSNNAVTNAMNVNINDAQMLNSLDNRAVHFQLKNVLTHENDNILYLYDNYNIQSNGKELDNIITNVLYVNNHSMTKALINLLLFNQDAPNQESFHQLSVINRLLKAIGHDNDLTCINNVMHHLNSFINEHTTEREIVECIGIYMNALHRYGLVREGLEYYWEQIGPNPKLNTLSCIETVMEFCCRSDSIRDGDLELFNRIMALNEQYLTLLNQEVGRGGDLTKPLSKLMYIYNWVIYAKFGKKEALLESIQSYHTLYKTDMTAYTMKLLVFNHVSLTGPALETLEEMKISYNYSEMNKLDVLIPMCDVFIAKLSEELDSMEKLAVLSSSLQVIHQFLYWQQSFYHKTKSIVSVELYTQVLQLIKQCVSNLTTSSNNQESNVYDINIQTHGLLFLQKACISIVNRFVFSDPVPSHLIVALMDVCVTLENVMESCHLNHGNDATIPNSRMNTSSKLDIDYNLTAELVLDPMTSSTNLDIAFNSTEWLKLIKKIDTHSIRSMKIQPQLDCKNYYNLRNSFSDNVGFTGFNRKTIFEQPLLCIQLAHIYKNAGQYKLLLSLYQQLTYIYSNQHGGSFLHEIKQITIDTLIYCEQNELVKLLEE